MIGDRWTLLVLREAFLRTRRFADFQKHTGAARNILSDRLQKLVEHGILERRPYQDAPPRDEYRLTGKGRDLYPLMMSMVAWGDRWMDDGRGRPVEHVHAGCGRVMHAQQVCSECGEPIHPRNVEPRPGPALRRKKHGRRLPGPR